MQYNTVDQTGAIILWGFIFIVIVLCLMSLLSNVFAPKPLVIVKPNDEGLQELLEARMENYYM